MSPYGEDDPAPGVPHPKVPLAEIGVSRWQYDLWYHIIKAALDGRPNQVPLDYHPALNEPALTRYGATSPALLNWMRHINADKPYSEQVKPFGFMVAPSFKPTAFDAGSAPVVDPGRKGRPPAARKLKPISPFSKVPAEAAAAATDRETGEPIPKANLKTYAEALRLYHLSPEEKFENGGPWDTGQTKRRHVKVKRIRLIGKEANKVGDFGEIDPIRGPQQIF